MNLLNDNKPTQGNLKMSFEIEIEDEKSIKEVVMKLAEDFIKEWEGI